MTCQVSRLDVDSLPRHALAIDQWPIGVALVDADGVVLESNARARHWLAQMAPEWPQLVGEMAPMASIEGDQTIRQVIMPDGSSLSVTAVGEPHGQVRLFMAEQPAPARAVSKAEDRRFDVLADLCESGAVFTLDPAGRIDGWSASAARYEGLSAADAVGLHLGALLTRSQMHVDPLRLLSASVAAGRAQMSGLRLAREGGFRWVRITLGCVRDAKGRVEGHVVRIDQPGRDTAREAELRRLADSDPLTGVLNRRAFDEAATAICATARAQGQSFAVVTLDLDAFKALNDRHGHAAGDAALRLLAEAARADLRAGDLIGRLGGDEFAVALPRASGDFAERVATRLRRTLARMVRQADGMPGFTASFGVAASADPGESFGTTLSRADEALYRAKQDGRDRVVLS
jgi:diguanylate cyclase (GGDEF)-like protein